jgi:hypothetical protein
MFSNQKVPIWVKLEGLAMEHVGIFKAISSILRPNGIFYGFFGTFGSHLVYFFPVLVCCSD